MVWSQNSKLHLNIDVIWFLFSIVFFFWFWVYITWVVVINVFFTLFIFIIGMQLLLMSFNLQKKFFFWFNFGTLNKTKTKIKRINLLINKMVIIKLWSASFFLFFYFVSLIAYTSLHTNYKQYTQFISFEPKPKNTILILKLKWCWNSQTANNLFNLVFLRYIQSFALYSFPDLSFPSHINKRKKWLNQDLALNIYFRMASFF